MKQKSLIKAFSLLALVLSLSMGSYAQGLTEGINLINKEKYKAATGFFNTKLASDAKNPEVYYRLGEISFLQGKYDEAKALYEKGVAADANFALNTIGIAKTYLAKKDTATARGFIVKVLEMPNVKQNSLDIAEAYAVTGQNLNEAITLINDSMKPEKKNAKAPKNPYGYYLLGSIYLQLNNGSEAIKYFELASDLDPKNIKAKLGCAAVYNTIKNYDEAKGYYLKALGIDTANPIANKEFADYYYTYFKDPKDAKDMPYQKSLYYHERYINNSEKTPSNMYRYATLAYLTRDFVKTVKIINEYLTMDDKSYGMLRLLAYSNFEIKDNAATVEAFKKYFAVVENGKSIPSDYEKYGRALLAVGDSSGTVENFIKCVELDSTMLDLYSEVGNILYKQKKIQDAIKYYELKASKGGKPKFMDYFNSGSGYFTLQNYVKADTNYAMATILLPKEAGLYMFRARCHDNMEDTSAAPVGLAKPYYEKAIEVASADPVKYKKILLESYDYLGRYCARNSDYKGAKDFYEKIIAIDPENAVAKQVLNDPAIKKLK